MPKVGKSLSSLLIITGLSGAGKSSAQAICADLGYYAIENLPVPLFPSFLDLIEAKPSKYKKVCLLLDVDSKESRDAVIKLLEKSLKERFQAELIFLDCSTETILKRYSETRRPHPGFSSL